MTAICRQQRVAAWLCAGLLLASVALIFTAASVGSTGFASVLLAWSDPAAQQIVWDIRSLFL